MRPVTKVLLLGAIAFAVLGAWWLQQPQGQQWLAKHTNPSQAGAAQQAQAAVASRPAAAPAPALIEATRARVQSVRDSVQAVGNVLSRQSTTLRPESSGRVAALHFQDGQRVKKGQLLLQLDDQLERAQLQQVDAELALAKAQYERNKELVAKGFISQAALDESAANLKVTQARRALAQTQVTRLRIVAPFDATAGIGNVHLGDYLREGDALVQLQDMEVLYVDFRLPERLSAVLRTGQTVEVELDAWPQERFTATVIAIDPLIDAQGRSIALRASLPNAGQRLRPGMFARVNLTLEERTHAVMVPEQAVLPDAQGAAIIRLTPWEEADRGKETAQWPAETVFRSERVPVQLGLRTPGWVEVRQGIDAGDVVMTAGQHRVNRSDQRVRVTWVSESALELLTDHSTAAPEGERTEATDFNGEPNGDAAAEASTAAAATH